MIEKTYVREFELHQFLLRVQEAIHDGYAVEDEPDNANYPVASPFGGFTVGLAREVDDIGGDQEALPDEQQGAPNRPKRAPRAFKGM